MVLDRYIRALRDQGVQKVFPNRHDPNRASINGNSNHLSKNLTAALLIVLFPQEGAHAALYSVKCAINKRESLGSAIVQERWRSAAPTADINAVRVYSTLTKCLNPRASTTAVIKNSLIRAVIVVTPRHWPIGVQRSIGKNTGGQNHMFGR